MLLLKALVFSFEIILDLHCHVFIMNLFSILLVLSLCLKLNANMLLVGPSKAHKIMTET